MADGVSWQVKFSLPFSGPVIYYDMMVTKKSGKLMVVFRGFYSYFVFPSILRGRPTRALWESLTPPPTQAATTSILNLTLQFNIQAI